MSEDKDRRSAGNLLREVTRLRGRLHRVLDAGAQAFSAEDSDSYDIGSYLVIQLAHLVTEELPAEILEHISVRDRQGLSAVRNVAAHDNMQMRHVLLWETLTAHVPRLLALIEQRLRE